MFRRSPIEPPSPRRLLAAGIATAALAAALAVAVALTPAEEADAKRAPAAEGPPNVVLLFTDDQEPATMKLMRTVRGELKRKGVTMKRFYTNFPLCCPSRATMLTGQYAHNHGVLSNQPPDGGFGRFDALHGGNSLPDWLQAAGYRTAYVGKYMNGYAEPDEYGGVPATVPAGWDEWRVLAPSRAEYFDYTLNQNGVLTDFGEQEKDYSTDKFTLKAKRFIRRSARRSEPYFLTLGYAAPHGGGGGAPGRSCNRGARPAPRHLGALKKVAKRKLRFSPSFNESDVSDKPSPLLETPPLTTGQIQDIKRKRRCAWESLLAVDESVGEILKAVQVSGEKRNTYVLYTSDNGFIRGEHRIRNQKRYLYEESARIPFVVRGPGVARNAKSDDVVVNADLTATILDIANAAPGVVQDGQSLLDTFAHPELEHGRAILLEAFAGIPILGVRTSRYLYAEWETDRPLPEVELYDTYVDPHQLNNLAHDPAHAGIRAELAAELDALRDCAGASCRTAPTGTVELTGSSSGDNGCAAEPVIARFTSPQASEVVAVTFKTGRKTTPPDTVAPFEAAVHYGQLRRALPEAGEVLARAEFQDGRSLAVTAKIKACR